MNPLQFLYDTVDIIKDGKNGKVSLVYDKVGKLFYVMKERDLRVAEIYRRLKNIKSPYLPEIYHAVEYDGKFFIVEEFIQGRTLYEILNRNNGLGEKKTAEIFKQLCDALKILHAQKIIHRDIKPSNIMITKNGGIKLIDFSISRITKENHETDTDFLGTRGYAPPEQYGFGQTDSRSDIYSVGVTIKIILGENYNGYLKKILAKCTELNPANRYQSVEEILVDIDKKFFRHKIKNAAVKISLTCAVIFFILIVGQNFLDSGKIPVTEIKNESSAVEENKIPPTLQPFLDSGKIPVTEIKNESPVVEENKIPPTLQPTPQNSESKKFKWAEIKIPDAVNIVPPIPTTPQILETNNVEKKSDPRLNRIFTVTLNGKIYNTDSGEIPADIWQTWENDGENIYLPKNFSVNLNIENKDTAPLNISVAADLKGLQVNRKIFPETYLAAGQSQNFEIPVGGMACTNGNFEVDIWLRQSNDDPLFGFWNGKNFGNKKTVSIYLIDYMKLKNLKKKNVAWCSSCIPQIKKFVL